MATNITCSFGILPPAIIRSSILPYIPSDDWLNFRTVSRTCYEIVHGTTDVSHSYCRLCQARRDEPRDGACDLFSLPFSNASLDESRRVASRSNAERPNEESEALWSFALTRDYRFRVGADDVRRTIHSPARSGRRGYSLSTKNVCTAATSFGSWKHWRKLEARRSDGGAVQVVGPYYLRAASLWNAIERWCDDDVKSCGMGRYVKASLRPGMFLTRSTKTDVMTALTAVYSFYSGQDDMADYNSLFGGYCATDCGCLMQWSCRGRHDEGQFILARDLLDDLVYIYLDLGSGKVVAANRHTGETIIATPVANRDVVTGEKIELDQEDSILRWFEEHARRLKTGYYFINKMDHDAPYPSILHFPSPTETTLCSRAVTRGVEVVASSIFRPFSNVSGGSAFIYCIRLRLLTRQDGEEYVSPKQRGFDTCQLHSHHWIVTKQISSTNTDLTKVEMRSDGVERGAFPLLEEGKHHGHYYGSADAASRDGRANYTKSESFVCHGYTDNLSRIFEGHLYFVPGSLKNPEGAMFAVQVAPFHLCPSPGFYY